MIRCLPIYLLLETSDDLIIESLTEGSRLLLQSLRSDPYALETVSLSIIAYGSEAEVHVPLTPIWQLDNIPPLSAGGQATWAPFWN